MQENKLNKNDLRWKSRETHSQWKQLILMLESILNLARGRMNLRLDVSSGF
jgi:hypothetical protein